MTELKTRHFIVMAVAVIASVAMVQDINLVELSEVWALLGGLATLDKVNSMFIERRKSGST